MKSSGEKSPASSAYAGTVTWLNYPRKIHQDLENVACWVQLLSEITLQVSLLGGPLCDASFPEDPWERRICHICSV